MTGGELQRRSSSSESDWAKIVAVPPKTYLEFTLADLKAGKIAFLAGDGVAKVDGGEGKKIVFQVQAADAPDNNANLSDSDPNDDDADPADAEIVIIVPTAEASRRTPRVLLNADGILTPNVGNTRCLEAGSGAALRTAVLWA